MAVDALNDHPNKLIRLLGPRYSKVMFTKAVNVADVRLARSLRDKVLIEERYDISVEYVPDGVSKSFINHNYAGDSFKHTYNINSDYMVYIGRLHPLKGIDIMIRAMSIIIDKSDIKVVIIGPGDQKPYKELARKISVDSRVIFLGFINEEDKIGAIDGSISVVLPSISNYVEVYPMILSEAWARAKPVIATTVGGIPYRVKHMINGLLIPPKNPKALAEAMIILDQDRSLGKKLGIEGRNSIFTWDDIIDKLLKLYSYSK
jgi:glycosyltransferase involved in cell wall biosynthesis